MPQKDLIQLAFACSKPTMTLMTPLFIVNFEHISHIAVVFPLLTLRNRVLKGFAQVSFLMTWNKLFVE